MRLDLLFALLATASPAPKADAEPPCIIGAATMKDDGTIDMVLHATGEHGELGEGMVSYRPGDPRYQETLTHLGGLKPGQSKAVSCWPEEKAVKPPASPVRK
jgi:hypothetical protein